VVHVEGCYGKFGFDSEDEGVASSGGRSSSSTVGCHTLAYFDKRTASRMSATMNMFKTVLVMFVLGFGALTFNSLAQNMVRPFVAFDCCFLLLLSDEC
jgi:hypothetical protein